MLSYLSKFVLQMLPTITATVIGAYIVSTWINPKAPAAGATRAAIWPLNMLAEGSPKPAQPAAEPVPAAEVADDVRANDGSDKIRVIPIVKDGGAAAERPVSAAATSPASPAQTADHRSATDLARAAILRLSGEADGAAKSHEPAAKPATVLRQPSLRPAMASAPQISVPQAPALAVTTPPVASSPIVMTSAPPLPPAITIAAPNSPPALNTDSDTPAMSAERLVPPREVPSREESSARNPLSLQASNRVAENPSLADNVLSATKSFFRAITPQELQR